VLACSPRTALRCAWTVLRIGVRLDAAFGDIKGDWRGSLGVFVPAVLAGKGCHTRKCAVGKRAGTCLPATGEPYRARCRSLEVLREVTLFIRRQGAVALGVGVGLKDVFVRGD